MKLGLELGVLGMPDVKVLGQIDMSGKGWSGRDSAIIRVEIMLAVR